MSEKLIREWVRGKLLKEAGKEHQEWEMIDTINSQASPSNPITLIDASGLEIPNIIGAEKIDGLNSFKKEPYADIAILVKGGRRLLVSMKDSTSPSLGGGGLAGLYHLIPDVVSDFLAQAEQYLLDQGFEAGDMVTDGVPEVSTALPTDHKIPVLTGTEAMGGPIDYYYQGPGRNITVSADASSIVFNGVFYTPAKLADAKDLYIVVRRRRTTQPFAPGQRDRQGLPSIFGRAAGKADNHRRVVLFPGVRGDEI